MMVRFVEDGGEPDELAPVTPLFGGAVIDAPPSSADDARDAAENHLLRKLRARSLSVSEARGVLVEHELDDDQIETLLDDFQRRGYLDDAALAEQIMHVGADRKGQGRQVIAQTMTKRGIPRDIAEAQLGALADDEAERALEFARSRAGRMSSLDETTALRRLHGQLARRGFGGHVAMDAARTALAETKSPVARVRFR